MKITKSRIEAINRMKKTNEKQFTVTLINLDEGTKNRSKIAGSLSFFNIMIRALIIDDEEHCIEGLQNLLAHDHKNIVEVAGSAKTVRDGIGAIALLRPDLVFLDVQIGNKTGFDLLRALPEINFEIIFTTAFEKFALHGYQVQRP